MFCCGLVADTVADMVAESDLARRVLKHLFHCRDAENAEKFLEKHGARSV